MNTIPEILKVFVQRTDICPEAVDWAVSVSTSSIEEASTQLSAEWYLIAASHYVRSEAEPVEACEAMFNEVVGVLTLRPVPTEITALFANTKAFLSTPCTNPKAKRVRLKAAFDATIGAWSTLGKPVELEPLVIAKLRPFVDFSKYADVLKK